MREIFYNEPNIIKFETSLHGDLLIPTELPIAKVYVGEEKSTITSSQPTDLEVVGESPGVYSVIVPQELIYMMRYARIEFSHKHIKYGTIKENKTFDIAQRLISLEDVNKNLGVDEAGDRYEITYTEYSVLESSVRKIIETYCMQEFSLWTGKRVIYGPRDYISLPQHLEKLYSVSPVGEDMPIDIVGSQVSHHLSDSGLVLEKRNNYATQTIFENDNKTNVYQTVYGLWGYEGIPSAVTEAAMELIRIYMVDDIDARRKYISNVTNNADVSLNFNWGSYVDSTGNPIADYLLKPFRVQTIAAV